VEASPPRFWGGEKQGFCSGSAWLRALFVLVMVLCAIPLARAAIDYIVKDDGQYYQWNPASEEWMPTGRYQFHPAESDDPSAGTSSYFPKTGIKPQDDANKLLFTETEVAAQKALGRAATGQGERPEDVDIHMAALGSYGVVTGGTIKGMMKNSLHGFSSEQDSDNDWCLESRQAMDQFRAQQDLKLAQSTANSTYAANDGWAGSSASPGTSGMDSSQADRWQRINAAMDDYEQAKNSPATRANEGYTLASEKQAFESVLSALNGENTQFQEQLQAQGVQVAALQGQLNDLVERIASKTAGIEEMKAKLADLKARAARAAAAGEQASAESRALQQEISQTEASIAAEEAGLQSLNSAKAPSLSYLNTLLSGLSASGKGATTPAGLPRTTTYGTWHGETPARSQIASTTASYAQGAAGNSDWASDPNVQSFLAKYNANKQQLNAINPHNDVPANPLNLQQLNTFIQNHRKK
jgi:hypothetical protein